MKSRATGQVFQLTAGYSHDFGKLSPLSPNYPTSDLGSSPRSSISVPSGLTPWSAYREHNKGSSFDLDEKARERRKFEKKEFFRI